MALRSLYRLPAPLLALLSLTTRSDATCYVAAYGLVGKQDGWSACPGTSTSPGGVETCCIPGSECGEDSLCKTPDSLNPGNNQWYQAGCTDASYSDPVCRNNCGAYTTTFIEWLSSEQQWMCCGNGGCNGTTTDDTFSAASPQSWKVITGAVSSSAVSTVATTATTGTSTPTPQDSTSSQSVSHVSSPSGNGVQSNVAASSSGLRTSRVAIKPTSLDFKPSGATQSTTSLYPAGHSTAGSSSVSATSSGSNNGGGLSTGAKAGIGVAVTLAALALVAAIIAILLLRRNRRVKETVEEKRVRGSVSTGISMNTHSTPAPPYQQAVEIGEADKREELSADAALYELPTHHHWSK